MGTQIVLMFIFLIAILLLLVFNELIYRRLGLKGEITRKFAHFTATLSTLTFPYLFSDHWYVLIMAVFFFILLFVSRNGTHLKSIHDIDRKSVGSYLLPISIYFTFLVSSLTGNMFLYILPILILAICDPMAGILGLNVKNYNHNIQIFGYKSKKTWLGSGSFFITSFIISIIALYFHRMVFDLKTFYLALYIARIFNLKTRFGAALDNLADMGTYLLALVGIFRFRWEVIQSHAWFLYIFLGIFTASYLVAFYRFGKIPGLHLYAAVAAGYIQGIFFFILFVFGFYAWLYYLVIGWGIIAYIEKTLVLLRIDEIKPGIKGLYWLIKKEDHRKHYNPLQG